MRKRIFVLSMIICVLVGGITTGCSQVKTSSNINISLMDPITISKNSINVSVDPRVELLSIVQYLSDYKNLGPGLMTNHSFNYKDSVKKHFIEFKEHEVIKLFDEMSKSSFSYDAPPGLMLFMNQEFGVRDDTELTDYIIMRAGGKKNIDKLFNALKDFCVETGFIDFFNGSTEYYNTIIDNTLLLISDEINLISKLEDYYGMQQGSYNMILASLHGGGSYGPQIITKEKGVEIYSIVGCQMLNGNLDPAFGTRNSFDYLQSHEFSHSFINPITLKNINLVNSYTDLYNPIEEKMKNMAYSTWQTCLDEHIIRALTSRFAYHEEESKGIMYLESEKQEDFIYVEALYNKLEEYENNRDKYPTIEDFYPELLKVLDEFM